MSESATEEKAIRVSKAAKELNITAGRIREFLKEKGIEIEANPNAKISDDVHRMLIREFGADMSVRQESEKQARESLLKKEQAVKDAETASANLAKKGLGEIEDKKAKASEIFKVPGVVQAAPKVLGTVELTPEKPKPVKGKSKEKEKEKEKEAETEEKTTESKKPSKAKKPETPAEIKPVPAALPEPEKPAEPDKPFRMDRKVLASPKVLDTIKLPPPQAPRSNPRHNDDPDGKKKKRARKSNAVGSSHMAPGEFRAPSPSQQNKPGFQKGKPAPRTDQPGGVMGDQISQKLFSLTGGKKKSPPRAGKRVKEKKAAEKALRDEAAMASGQDKILKVTEFVSVNELAKMMDIPYIQVISSCMTLGYMVNINTRVDAEVISLVAGEFGFKVEFITLEESEEQQSMVADDPANLKPRPPIVTVMGHVDHGKTSLLDFIRKSNVIAGEAGGITQHIGAYEVTLESGKQITFLDTPGHEAFTAMRARGAKLTDVAIIVVAADDSVMPQTIEAINHAQAANVPIVIAINKIDKPGAAPEKIRERLAQMNILVEDWGGKFQCQEISAKQGLNIEKLLEKVLLEAELLELKANPDRLAVGTVIESSLDKGRGYVTTLLVQAGSLRVGDVLLAGTFSGRVKAMFNERGQKVDVAGPATPVLILGLSGAPQAGDTFKVMEDEREAREIANKKMQLVREQGIRTHKHITLDEIGRRLAIGNFKELNVIVKGDVDGSVEALADSFQKLSTEEIQLNVIHKSVGQISESDVLLASASNAIIIGFQVRPSLGARKLAETEQIDIRLYSIIYDAINEVKSAMEGMLAPEMQEKITCNVEIRTVFKISKSGTVAGCMVLDGKVSRNSKIRLIRDGIVVFTGELSSLKRFKDDVKEVATGYECGMSIENFNDIKEGDIIEGYEMVEVKRKI